MVKSAPCPRTFHSDTQKPFAYLGRQSSICIWRREKKKNHGWQRLQPKSCCTTWPDSCTSTGPLTKHNNIVLLVSPRASQSRHLRPRSNRSQCALANWEVLWNSMSFMPYIFCEYPTCIYIYIYTVSHFSIQHPTAPNRNPPSLQVLELHLSVERTSWSTTKQ